MAAPNAGAPGGLHYYSACIPDEDLADTEEWLKSAEFQSELKGVTGNPQSRKVAQFGYKYGYGSGSVVEGAAEFPPEVKNLRDMIPDIHEGVTAEQFNQCIINRYLPGQGISAHADSQQFGPVIACFTFGSPREMEFARRYDAYRILTEPGSMYVMSGDSRALWTHEMKSRKSDPPPEGQTKRLARGTVYSVTFREVHV